MVRNKIPAIVICAFTASINTRGIATCINDWAASGVKELKKSGRFEVIPIFGEDAMRSRISDALTKVRGRRGLVVFYGHGCVNAECLFSCDNEDESDRRAGLSPSNCGLLRGKIVYVVACHSAKRHGYRSVTHGARCYIGYKDSIVVMLGREFTRSVNAGLRVFASKQGSCRDAWNAIRNEYYTYYRQYVRDKSTLHIALNLYINLDALVKPIGDTMACA